MLIKKFIMLTLVLSTIVGQSCKPRLLLGDAIQDSVELTVFTAQESIKVGRYAYPFAPSYFSAAPLPLLSIGALTVESYAEVNYLLGWQVESNRLVMVFSSSNMVWKMVRVHLILHSRSDIFSQVDTIETQPGVQTKLQPVKTEPAVTGSLVYFHFILGLRASYASNYEISLDSVHLSYNNGQYTVFTNAKAALTLQTIYFDATTTNFVYDFQQILSTETQSFLSEQIWLEVGPPVYTLVGINHLSFSGSSLKIQTSFSPSTQLFSLSASPTITKLEVLFFSIAPQPASVCAPCNDYFISVESCLPSCPAHTFPSSLTSGGKVCRECSSQLGQSLSQDGVSCSCSKGQFFKGKCYTSGTPPNCSSSQLLIGGKCLMKDTTQALSCPANASPKPDLSGCSCNQGFDSVGKECLAACPSNSRRTSAAICACEYGFIMTASRQCQSICPPNAVYQVTTKQCKCSPNYEMIKGVCSKCPSGQVYDAGSGSCLAAILAKGKANDKLLVCQQNEVENGGKCVCDQWSIKINGRCLPCPPKHFKKADLCLSCPHYCLTCSSQSTCKKCQQGFDLIGNSCMEKCGDGRRFVVQCDDGNNRPGDGCSPDCKIENGYLCSGGGPIATDTCQPVSSAKQLHIKVNSQYGTRYVTGAIITEFLVTPPLIRSQNQLFSLFRITFSNQQARPDVTYLSQSSSDPASVRCVFSYPDGLPNFFFGVEFEVLDYLFGQSRLSLNYDPLSNGITSAIRRSPTTDILA